MFIQSLLKLHILGNKSGDIVRVTSINDLNKIFKDSQDLQDEYEVLKTRVFEFFNEGRLNVTIRNREILLNYLRNNFEDVLSNIHEEHLNIFGKERYAFEYSKDYLNYLRKTNITQNAFNELKTGTVEDLYNILISSGERIFYKKGILEGQIAAKKIQEILSTEDKQIKALSIGSKYLVLDYDRVYANGDPTEFDTVKLTEKEIVYSNTAQEALKDKKGFSKMFEYLTKGRYLTPDVYDINKLNFVLDENESSLVIEEGASKLSIDNLTTDFTDNIKELVYEKARSLYNKYLNRNDNTTMAERFGLESKTSLSLSGNVIPYGHVYDNRSLEGNPWIWFFHKKTKVKQVKLTENDSFYIRNYRISKDVNSNDLYQIGDDKFKIRFTPVKLEQSGNFFLVHKNEETDAYVMEYTGNLASDSIDQLTIDSFSNEELFIKIASMNTHNLLNANDALDKSPTYDSKEGNSFSFLYTGESNDSRVEGPFFIQKESRRTIAVKYSKENAGEVEARYFIPFEERNLINKKAIWTLLIENSDDINLTTDVSENINETDTLPTQEDINKAKKDCSE